MSEGGFDHATQGIWKRAWVGERREAPGAPLGKCDERDGERVPGVCPVSLDVATGGRDGAEHGADGAGEDGCECALSMASWAEESCSRVGDGTDLDLVEIRGFEDVRDELAVLGTFAPDAPDNEEPRAVSADHAPDEPTNRPTTVCRSAGGAKREREHREILCGEGLTWAFANTWSERRPQTIQDGKPPISGTQYNPGKRTRKSPRNTKIAVHKGEWVTLRTAVCCGRGARWIGCARAPTANGGPGGSPQSREPWKAGVIRGCSISVRILHF
jgi:hypothetical protein